MSARPALLALLILLATSPVPAADAQSCSPAAVLLSGATATPFCTVQGAIDASIPYDTVLVLDPVVAHLEALTIPASRHNLTLCASDTAMTGCGDASRPLVDSSGSGAAQTLNILARDVTVSSLTLRGPTLVVRATSAHGLRFVGNTVEVETSPVGARHGIDVRNSLSPTVEGNQILGNMYPGSIAIAFRTVTDGAARDNEITRSGTSIYTATSTGVTVSGNHITVPAVSQYAGDSLGISFFRGSGHASHHNTVEGAGIALTIKGASSVQAHNDTYTSAVTGVRLSAAMGSEQPSGLVLRDMGLAGTETALLFMAGFDAATGLTVDARCVDWGAYTRMTIEGRIEDASGTNTVLFQPWTVPETDGPRCLVPPRAAIGVGPGPHTRLGPVPFTDATTVGSRAIASRSWTFGDGTTSTQQDPQHPYAAIGTYPVTLTVTDTVGEVDRAETTVVIADLLPEFDPLPDRTLPEGTAVAFTVRASDAEADPIALTIDPMPTGLAFTDNGDGTAAFAWTPDHSQAGVYAFTVTANDTFATNTTAFTITVTDLNGAPVLDPIGSRSIAEDQTLAFEVRATDPDGEPISIAAFVLPPYASFVDHGDGTGTFTWRPTYFQSGDYDLTFQATDGVRIDRETIQIQVVNVNRPPVLAAIGDRSVQVGNTLSFFVSGTDPDGETLTYDAANLPLGASFDKARRLFTWTPTQSQSGAWTDVRFTVSDGALSHTRSVTITVVLDQTFAVAIEPVGPTARAAAAGEVVTFDAIVANIGSSTRTYALSAGPIPLGWGVTLNRTVVTIASGQVAPIRLTITPNDDFGQREVFLTADDTLSQASLRFAVALPVTVAVEITRISMTREIMGEVRASYHDGTPARNHAVTVYEKTAVPLQVQTQVSGDTNAEGVMVFRLPLDLVASNRPGGHFVQAHYQAGSHLFRGLTEYFVGTETIY